MGIAYFTTSHTDLMMLAVNGCVAEFGFTGLTLRRVSDLCRMSPPSLLQHFESRERMLEIAAARTCEERLDHLARSGLAHGPTALLPEDDDALIDERVWLAWNEYARCADSVAQALASYRDDELDLLARCVGHRVTRESLVELQGLLDGLRAAICAPLRPLPREAAHDVVARWVDARLPGAA